MRKQFTVFLCAVLLAGCGAKTAPSVSGTTETAAPQAAAQAPEKTPETVKTEFDTSGTIEETTLFEQDGVIVKATELTYESSRAKLLVNVENNSGRAVQILSGTMGYSCNAVNGWMVHDGWINLEVPAGKKANGNAYFDYAPMLACGIHGIETLYMSLQVEYDGDYSTTRTLDPVEIRTSLADAGDEDLPFDQVSTNLLNVWKGNRTLQFYDSQELFNAAGIRITGAAYFTDPDNKKYLVLELFNDADQVLDVDTKNIAANGFVLCNGRWSSNDIMPGKRDYMTLELTIMKDEDDWKAMGITDVTDITLDVGVRNTNYDYISQPSPIAIHVSDSAGAGEPAAADGSELYSGNGVRIISKGLSEDSIYVKWKLLIENSNDFEITVTDGWGDKLSINDYMVDYLMWSTDVGAHQSAIMEIEINKDSLEASGMDINSIGTAEIELEIKDESYNNIAAPVLVNDFSAE